MATDYEITDALDDLRAGSPGRMNTILNAMIRARGVKDDHMRDEVRSDVLQFIGQQITAGIRSEQISKPLKSVVRNSAVDAIRRKAAARKRVEDDPDESDRRLVAPSAEEEYEMYENYIALESALSAMRTSAKKADRRQFAALDAAMKGESPRERLAREFGENITDNTAAQVVLRAREKLSEVCGIPRNRKRS